MSEAWVVSLLLATGLMAQAWAQAQAMAEQSEQQARWLSMELAQQLDARMRSHPQLHANPSAVSLLYKFNGRLLQRLETTASPNLPPNCLQNGCSGQELALWDLNDWLVRAQQQLSLGWVEVNVHAYALENLAGWSITVGWPSNMAAQTPDCPSGFACYRLDHAQP